MDYLTYLFKSYLPLPSTENASLKEQYNIFLLENGLSEHADIIVHIESYTYGLSVAKFFDKRGSFASNPKDFISAMKSPICLETTREFLETIDDRFIPEGRDHIFKQKIKNNFNIRMSLDGLSKTAVYYVLIHEIISGLRLQIKDNRTIYKQYDYKLAKLLASLWVAIIIPDDIISERIFQYFINAYWMMLIK